MSYSKTAELPDVTIRTVFDSEFDDSIEEAAAREVRCMTMVRQVYPFVPSASCEGNVITTQRIIGTRMDHLFKTIPRESHKPYFLKVEQAVRGICEAGVLHLGITMDNMIVDANGNVWITIFESALLHKDSPKRNGQLLTQSESIKRMLETFYDTYHDAFTYYS